MRLATAFVACFFVQMGTAVVGVADETSPNVVILLVDDLGWADIGYNNSRVYSPNLDRLAAGGVTFTQHYVMPQCTPTRVALMTGRYPSRFGGAALKASNEPAFPVGTLTMASLFQANGYRTCLTGKWHLGSSPEFGPNHFGFDSSYGSLAGAVGMYDHRYRTGTFEQTWHRDHQLISGAENGTHATDLVTQEAVRVIKASHEQPFFLYVPFHAVHTPLDERGEFIDRPTMIDLDKTDRWLNEDRIEWFHDPEGLIQRERDPEKRLLLAAVHHLDDAVGQIVEALEQNGLRENTLLLFSSDNGPQGSWKGNAYPDDLKLSDFNQPLPMRGKKLDVWEGGIHVPAFANWPDRLSARNESTPTHVVDWLPTLVSLLKFDAGIPKNLDGVDLTPMLVNREPIPERELYWTWNPRINRWALRHGDWKIVHYGQDQPVVATDWELYNLVEDPRESKNLAAARPELLTAMHDRFLKQRARDAH